MRHAHLALRSLALRNASSRKPAAQGCRLGPIKASLDLKAASWRQFQRARVRAPPGWRRAMSRSFKARRRRAGLLDGRSSAAVIFLDGRRCQRPEAVAADAPPCTLVPHFEKRRTRGTREHANTELRLVEYVTRIYPPPGLGTPKGVLQVSLCLWSSPEYS